MHKLPWRPTVPVLLACLLPLATAAEPNRPALKLKIQQTPGGVQYGLLGEKGPKPAPTVFLFATALKSMTGDSYYTHVARLLAPHGFIAVVLDPPCHGADAKPDEPRELGGWAARLQKGDGLVPPFTARASAVLDHLIKEGYTDPQRVCACGTSRGGFLAYHFAAADPRVKAVAGFSPVTNLLALTEFAGMKDHAATQRLNLVQHAPRLAGRAVWVSIGNHDLRVSTDDVVAFARKVVAESAAKQKNANQAIPVELIVGASVGHRGIAQEHERCAAWLLQQLMPEARQP